MRTMPAYRRLSRKRLRMVLEAVEDQLRGWTATTLTEAQTSLTCAVATEAGAT